MSRIRWTFALVALCLCTAAVQSQEFFLKKGDVVVVMGDSITEQRQYSKYFELWALTRFPDYNLVFRNVGIGGDRSTGGNSRFKRDVLPHKPTVLTVDFGMNDGSYKAFSELTFDPYMKGLQGIADQAKAAGIRVAWITPQPTERRQEGTQLTDYNVTLEKFSEGVGEIAKKNNGLFVDQFHPYLNVMEKARKADPKAVIMQGDAVHPGPTGQTVMAAAILKGMNFPREVSSVSIDVSKSEAATKNCKVSKLDTKDGVRFDRLDSALPYFPAKAEPILKWAPILEELNDYGLQVKGLPTGKYEVRLNNEIVADYSSEDLAKGVNLAGPALAKGPIADQIAEIVKAVEDKTNYYHGQIYRGLILAQVAKLPEFKDLDPNQIQAKKDELVAERMKKMPELDAAIHKATQPRSVTVTIVAKK